MPATKLGVIGAGVMGSNHFRVALRNPSVKLTAVCDNNLDLIEQLDIADDVTIVSDPEKLIDLVDGVVIATPTGTHYTLAKMFLKESIAVLVEKPIASSVEEAEELMQIASQNNTVFMVGHIERFNSAVIALPQYIDKPLHFEFRRISPFSGRVRESIVTDLMIHDLELLCFLNPSKIVSIQAISQITKSDWNDFATALISFENGSTAMLTASRIGQQKIRTIEISQADSVIVADLLRQDIVISKVDHVEYVTDGGVRFKQHGVMEIPFIDRYGEPLILEQQEFVKAIQEDRNPAVDPATATLALSLAHQIEEMLKKSILASV